MPRGEERERFPAVCVRWLKCPLLALLPAVRFKHLSEPEPWASGAVEAREAAGRRLLSPREHGPERSGGAESAERAAQWRLLRARSQEAWGDPCRCQPCCRIGEQQCYATWSTSNCADFAGVGLPLYRRSIQLSPANRSGSPAPGLIGRRKGFSSPSPSCSPCPGEASARRSRSSVTMW